MIYNIRFGQYGGPLTKPYQVDIPDNVKFFYDKNVIGRMRFRECNHYTTILPKDSDISWADNVGNAYDYEMGNYVVLVFENVSNETPLPTIEREEWFRINNIDLSKYVFITYDTNFRIENVFRVLKFENIWDMDVVYATMRDFFSQGEMYRIVKDNAEFDAWFPYSFDEKRSVKYKTGEEAEVLWNSVIANTLRMCMYNPDKANPNYDFLSHQKEVLDIINMDLDDFKKLIRE